MISVGQAKSDVEDDSIYRQMVPHDSRDDRQLHCTKGLFSIQNHKIALVRPIAIWMWMQPRTSIRLFGIAMGSGSLSFAATQADRSPLIKGGNIDGN
jgi:hypothetical protein